MTAVAELLAVSKRYGRHAAIDAVSLTLNRGEILGLIGPNGAGKTTLLRVLAVLSRPTAGSVRVDERTAATAVRYFGGERTLPPNVSARQWLTLWHARNSPSATRRALGVLSRGTRQRVGLEAMLAARDTTLLLLDEPWEGLDPDASRWLSETLLDKRAAGTAIVVSSHRLHDLADVCDRCVFLVAGRLASQATMCGAMSGPADRSAILLAAFDRARGQS